MITTKNGTVETLISDALQEVDALVKRQQRIKQLGHDWYHDTLAGLVYNQFPIRPQTAGIKVIYGVTDYSMKKKKTRSAHLRDAIELLETAERAVRYHGYHDADLLQWLNKTLVDLREKAWPTLFNTPYVSREGISGAAGELSPRPPPSYYLPPDATEPQ